VTQTTISTAQAARILRISTEEVRRLIVKSRIEATRKGASHWRVNYASIIDYMEAAQRSK
jgi:excisionase family DNA binding protein